ncbi:hypothetical protein JHN59_08670 [Streptomyces sp. MBT49]|uniref:hypothetical protein n=1 Tax=unclassified Streptomyces TaxID=2593676 RepID=UPI00190AAABE|nr:MULTISPECIES: hypothetical protein [unclassified Streptomyces]MBK3624920.1 hypothetical protein [Streptomyces sp. MBT49]MBK3632564.1 hypothetical protein [Streptomyces sp. MBT97]
MDTLTSPGPEFPTTPQAPAEPTPALPPMPAGPVCALCSAAALVHWQRRPTDDELNEIRATEEKRRIHALKMADVQHPEPAFPPLPTAADTLRAVYACGRHAITLDGAARIHSSSCTAPNEADLPGCDCTPTSPPPAPLEEDTATELPEHWLTGGA